MITTDQLLTAALEWINENAALDAEPDDTARSLELDNLDIAEMQIALEAELDVKIPDVELRPEHTLRQWAASVAKEINK